MHQHQTGGATPICLTTRRCHSTHPPGRTQRDLLASLAPSGSGGGGGGAGRRRLRSLRQLGWPLGPRGVLSLLHDQVSDVMRVPVAITPIVLRDMFASAAGVAGVVRDFLNEGRSMVQAEQYLLTVSVGDTPLIHPRPASQVFIPAASYERPWLCCFHPPVLLSDTHPLCYPASA